MEPYRAFVGDKLPNEQLTFGYQMQSLFVGAGITIATFRYLFFKTWLSSPTDESTRCSIGVNSIPGCILLIFYWVCTCINSTVMWSVWKTPEIPPSNSDENSSKMLLIQENQVLLIQIISVIFCYSHYLLL